MEKGGHDENIALEQNKDGAAGILAQDTGTHLGETYNKFPN